MNCLFDLTWLSFGLNFAPQYLIIKRMIAPSFCKSLLNYTFKLGYFRGKILFSVSLCFFCRGLSSSGDGEGRGCPPAGSVRPVGVSPVAPPAVSSMCELDSVTVE